MLLDVVIAACAAFAAAGVVYGTLRLLRVKPPKTLILAVAAVAILGVTAYQRYDWHQRVIRLLPEDMVVVEKLKTSVWVEPWSLVEPVISSVVAVDTASVRRNPAHPGLILVDLLVLSRDDDTVIVRNIVDCAERKVAPLPTDAVFTADGLPADLDWREGAPDVLFDAVCSEG